MSCSAAATDMEALAAGLVMDAVPTMEKFREAGVDGRNRRQEVSKLETPASFL